MCLLFEVNATGPIDRARTVSSEIFGLAYEWQSCYKLHVTNDCMYCTCLKAVTQTNVGAAEENNDTNKNIIYITKILKNHFFNIRSKLINKL